MVHDPGVTLLTIAGLAAAITGGFPILRTGWISLILLIISGLSVMFSVGPLRRKITALARVGSADQFNWSAINHYVAAGCSGARSRRSRRSLRWC